MSQCSCADDWRVETLNLATGERRKFLTPTSISFDQLLNEVGRADISLPIRSVDMASVWPHLTSIAISRISGPDASPTNPKGEFIGMIEDVQASSGGTLQLGLNSIESYLNYRMIGTDVAISGIQQTVIAANLVNLGYANGVPLVGVSDPSSITRDRNYALTDRKIILEAVQQLTEVINGPDYLLEHSLSQGSWSTNIRFLDVAGNQNPTSINVTQGVSEYDLKVSGSNHVNRVIGVGEDPSMSYDADSSVGSIYPLFERSVSWSDVSVPATLQDHSQGELQNNDHPLATPSITLVGTNQAPTLGLGDVIDLTMDHGAIQYRGLARLVGKSWSSSGDSPTMCTLSLVPLDDAEDAILNAPAPRSKCC